MKKIICLVFLGVILVGCAKTVQLTTRISDDELVSLQNATGENVIKGSALLRRNDGAVVTCAGNDVVLIPVVPYTTEKVQVVFGNTTKGYNQVYQNAVKFDNEDPNYAKIREKSICNAHGFFEFDNLADGEYYVTTYIVWNPTGNLLGEQGGILMQKVSVSGNEEVEIVLAP